MIRLLIFAAVQILKFTGLSDAEIELILKNNAIQYNMYI